jgi:hypothetical protein
VVDGLCFRVGSSYVSGKTDVIEVKTRMLLMPCRAASVAGLTINSEWFWRAAESACLVKATLPRLDDGDYVMSLVVEK